jgi:hypothetical protein
MKQGAFSILWLLLIFGVSTAWSADPEDKAPAHEKTSATTKKAGQPAAPRPMPNVLNFDADVIEGDKSNPDLFIQLGNQQPSLESVIYGRKNFNEFQKHEAPWRPVYRETTQPPSKPANPARSKK